MKTFRLVPCANGFFIMTPQNNYLGKNGKVYQVLRKKACLFKYWTQATRMFPASFYNAKLVLPKLV